MGSENYNLGHYLINRKDKLEGVLKGVPSSPGIAIGKAKIILPEAFSQDSAVNYNTLDAEFEKFQLTLNAVIKEFDEVILRIDAESNNVKAIIETNVLILKDPVLIDSIENCIKNGNSAESAVIKVFDTQKSYFNRSKDSIMREKAVELDHLKKRLVLGLRQKQIIKDVPENSIIVAQVLTPTDIINLKESKVAAIVTEVGGIASHASILARSFGIPEVISVKNALNLLQDNTTLIVDAYSGDIVLNPRKTAIANYIIKRDKVLQNKKRLGELAKLPTKTADGKRIHLRANIDSADEIHDAIMMGAEGSGLVRSESLIIKMNRIPDEETQFQWYKNLSESAYPKPVAIRAFDIGSDKFSEGMPHSEENPALGFRGIRFLLARKDVFMTQIRAILRASSNKNIKIILPMISGVDEVVKSKELIELAKRQLLEENFSYDRNLPLGIMIETPASAIIADGLAELVDFFSIGTNDLTQYVLGADRNNELVSDIYDSFHPAVIRLIKTAADAANKKGIPVSVCGELAGHSAATELLIGLGINELSISPPSILEMKGRISEINTKNCAAIAENALLCKNNDQLRKVLA